MAERGRPVVPADDLAMYRAIVGGNIRDRTGAGGDVAGRRDPDTPHAPTPSTRPPGWRRRVDDARRLAVTRFREGVARLFG